MTSDDQQFLDLLASIPQDMAAYGSRIADYIEKHTNAIASDIRDAIDNADWIPDSLRPPRQPASGPSYFPRPPSPPQGLLEKTTTWVSKNRTIIAVCVAFAGTTLFMIHRRKKAHARKRRAKKLPNGGKKEIVVLACSTFHDALTRSLALDLERRGYVVYVTVSSTEEDSLVHQEAKPDLRPLWIDLTSTVPNPAVDVHPNLEPIRELLSHPVQTQNHMSLAGIVVFPGCSGYAEGPLALLPPSDIVDNINTRLVSPVLTVQQFLPLLANHSVDPKSPASIVIAYPSIPNSLSPPRQIPECLVTSSLSALASSLKRELKAASANITVSELKLGNFDMGSVTSSRTTPTQSAYHASNTPGASSALMPWHSSQRAALQRKTLGQRSFIRGASAREFHNAVFDALAPPQTFKAFGRFEWTATRRPGVVFVGTGARIYDVVGRIMPDGLVAFMMGHRRREDDETDVRQARVRHFAQNDQRRRDSSGGSAERGPAASTVWGFGSAGSESGIWEKV
ncbi:hypothetical protein PV08_00764 [Exophiala spinifera]|uniref:DUF1776-domain-containing protein n=1 Tax=Exophiala spinifera TaxID=91928 RepID=A0A0D2C9C8_9EURO|nr:uncharacterized protein PV08_00764 [Exophiala spinifera]KIW20189.1 hypothetical protein PV08_00764 [Exophiala spinifera]